MVEMYRGLNMEPEEEKMEYLKDDGQPEEEEVVSWQFCVVARLLTEKSINFQIFRQIMASVWRPVKGVIVKELRNNDYLF